MGPANAQNIPTPSGPQHSPAIMSILVIYTGGTIGMAPSVTGLVPKPNFLAGFLRAQPSFHDSAHDGPGLLLPANRFGRRVRYELLEYEQLLDSANMGLEDWKRIARDLERHYHEYDAFVVLHGTDTMAYTASALSFMLENLEKTVIVTGSQLPLIEPMSDGHDNLLGALTLAGRFVIPEVSVYFDKKLIRGNRTTKTDADSMDAFASPNASPLSHVGSTIDMQWDRMFYPTRPQGGLGEAAKGGGKVRVGTSGFRAYTSQIEPNVAVLTLFPSITAAILRNFLQAPLMAVVLLTFGAGNFPDNRPVLIGELQKAIARGVVVVNCTQCIKGMVSTDYATGTQLQRAGVINGGDMTTEATLTKLMYLLGRYPADRDRQLVASLVTQNLRGEITPETDAQREGFRESFGYQTLRLREPASKL